MFYLVTFALLLNVFCHVCSDETGVDDSRKKRAPQFSKPKFNVDNSKEWNFRYFPPRGAFSVDHPRMFHDRKDIFNVLADCDDGKKHIENDFDGSPEEYTCSQSSKNISTVRDLPAIIYEEIIPPFYVAPHVCINYPIDYSTSLPTFGPHRPIWAKYGEYKFLPPERWLHNAEHGAVIMLYHPCANATQVDLLRNIVTQCLRRHIITPYKLLSPDRPIALLTWGWYLAMAHVDSKLVKQFIKDHALRVFENTPVNGIFDHLLMKAALIVTDEDDTTLCPYL